MDNNAVFKLSYGLYVLSAREGEKDNGCIVNTFMQITSAPLLVAVGVNKDNYTCGMIARTKRFNVTALTEQTPFAVFERFGFQSGKTVDKYAGRSITRADNGVAYESEYANAYFSCRVIEEIDFGTHILFKAEIEDMRTLSDAPSLTYAYYHAHVKPQPQAAAPTGKTKWRCTVCGYEYEGETLPPDFICPICKHGAEAFVKV